MSSFQERVEEERRRLAEEQARLAEERAMSLEITRKESERLHQEHEARAIKAIDIFRQLGVWRTLAEIQRDLWKGNGSLRPPTDSGLRQYSSPIYKIYAGLVAEVKIFEPKTEKAYKHVFGAYQTTSNHSDGGGEFRGGVSYHTEHHRGWHDEYIGERVIGVQESSRTIIIEEISGTLEYNTDDVCKLRVAGEELPSAFSIASPLNIDTLVEFVDHAFLRRVAKSEPPDFERIKERDEESFSYIQGHIGDVMRDPQYGLGFAR